jgi:hypothetical protein
MNSQDLGSLGETEFKRLCLTAGGLTIHESQSQMDRTGWDFLIEFPFEYNNHMPHDLLPAPLECKIQVKSTSKQRKRESIKLSNLIRLVKAQMPTFFCFIEFDEENRAKAFYLVHIGEEIIGSALKRIRELESKGLQSKLNKHTLDISYNEADQLKNITGEELKQAIQRVVPNGPEQYIENKNQLLKTIGFEDGGYELKVTVVGKDPIKDILEIGLGIKDKIEVYESSGYHKRFGIVANTPEIHQGGTLSLFIKPLDAKLKFLEQNLPLGVSFGAKLYVPPFNKFIPEESIKIRVESSFFEFIIGMNGDEGDYLVHPFPQEDVCLKEAIAFLDFLLILKESSKPITVELEPQGVDSFPVFRFYSKNLPSSLFELEELAYQVSSWEDLAVTANQLLKLCAKLCIPENDLYFNFEELLRLRQHTGFILLYQAICRHFEPGLLLFSQEFDRYARGSKVVSVFFANFCLGNHMIGCCLAGAGRLSPQSGQNALLCDEILVGKQFFRTKENIKREQIESSVSKFVNELEEGGDFVLVTVSL